jgi:hypothetical protein
MLYDNKPDHEGQEKVLDAGQGKSSCGLIAMGKVKEKV